jgi:acyl transferase domain-containing protein
MCIDFKALNFNVGSARDVALPAYPFQRKQMGYGRGTGSSSTNGEHKAVLGPLVRHNATISAATHPEIAEHVIRGEPVMPGAAYLEMVKVLYSTHVPCSYQWALGI